MDVNVIGRVNNLNLSLTKGILPVFEAVINSIQANISSGDASIELHISRRKDQPELVSDDTLLPDIENFTIIDNGSGFNTENYQSFNTSDSTNKYDIGGKGVGRFLWLKAFENAEIDSVFYEEEKFKHRRFNFIMRGDGIDNHVLSEDINASKNKTIVTLRNLKSKYLKYMPKKASSIAQKLFEYCLSYFIYGLSMDIQVIDDYTGENISLLQLYEDLIRENTKTIEFNFDELAFNLALIHYPTRSETIHRITYCAHKREVRSENISEYFPLLCQRLTEKDENEFVVYAYISSPYFDSLVNSERTQFIMNENIDQEEFIYDNSIKFSTIREKVIDLIKEDINPLLKKVREQHIERISRLVHEQIPEYRSVLKYKGDELDNISPSYSNERIELELHKIQQQLERDTKKKSKELIEKEPKNAEEEKQFFINYDRMAEELSDLGKDKLVQYVLHRKSIIHLFENRLKRRNDGNFPLEEAIHSLIMPMKITSDDTEYNRQNLWMIDEKLAYHYYLASDKHLQKNKGSYSKRPDLLIFDKPIAFTDDSQPYSSVVIIEFKRPQRNDYTDANNPISQVQEYIRIIRRGEATDKDSRPIIVNETSKFYAYIICDITTKLDELAENQSAIKSPDNMGYFWFNHYIKTYFEIIPFEKLLLDSKKRNKVLFDKLGLPMSLNEF